ncbi:hypothetical protein BDY24DRAFT_361005 [Mrakia frigida]|uniref:uncharacterized protein n=1 Tax=Mrakia frigida TaxID=29902 RepID=UPI003FCC22F6
MTKKKARDPLPPFAFSTFSVPGQVNIKNVNSTYLKGEAQQGWAKRATPTFSEHQQQQTAEDLDLPNGYKTIVIHPGSKTIRIGRASDYSPLQIDNIIARKRRSPLLSPPSSSMTNGNGSLSAAEKGKGRASEEGGAQDMDVDGEEGAAVEGVESTSPPAPQTAMDLKIASLRQTLNHRTTSLKLRPLPQARAFAASYNADSVGESVEDFNDPFRVEWDLDGKAHGDVVVGSEVYKLSTSIWDVRQPWLDRTFNQRDYSSLQANVGDMEELLREALVDQMKIGAKDLKTYSAILVIPDHAPQRYVQEMTEMLLGEKGKLGFKQICMQQESLGATFGAGLSSACVIDIGARKTTIACVEDGMVLPETRHTLSYGGDDITSFLAVLLRESHFPYKELDLSRSYDWNLIEGLKERFCTLSEAQVGVNLYDFFVRRPKKLTQKFTIKTFDEVILAPMCLFEPRVIDFDGKLKGLSSFALPREGVEEAGDYSLDQPTLAMNHSTFHLRPPPPPPPPPQAVPAPAPAPIALSQPTTPSVEASSVAQPASKQPMNPLQPPSASSAPLPLPPSTNDASAPTSSLPPPPPSISPLPQTSFVPPPSDELPLHIPLPPLVPPPPPAPPVVEEQPLGFDILEESGKVPLDVGIVNTLMSCGTEERVRRMAGSLLLVGGTAGLPALGYAIQSRVLPILNSRIPSLQTVEIIPSPREIDPRLLVWKGVSVLARLESVNEFWVGRQEWERLGLRALREKSLFL